MQQWIAEYIAAQQRALSTISAAQLAPLIETLREAHKNDRQIFAIGNGGSAANAAHAVNDFRKIAGFEAYAPTDNVSELTARTNDEGWATVFAEWLRGSRLTAKDALLVLSVGGGDLLRPGRPLLRSRACRWRGHRRRIRRRRG